MAERGGSDSDDSSSSSGEEDRLRRLFESCDADRDGYLDKEDLALMCGLLNMADSVEEVRRTLGLRGEDRISLHDFLTVRSRVMQQECDGRSFTQNVQSGYVFDPGQSGTDTGVDSDTSLIHHRITAIPTLSSDSLALSSQQPDSADYDSGAPDLHSDLHPSHTTLTLTQVMEGHNPQALTQLRQCGGEGALDLADQIHTAALTSLKGEILELKCQVRRLTSDSSMLDDRGQSPKSPGPTKCNEDPLHQLTSRYEERIIELHSVIAELRKKVDRHHINVIREEEEFEDSDQVGSGQDVDSASGRDENNEICQEFSQVVSEMETTLARKPVENLSSQDEEAEVKKHQAALDDDVTDDTVPDGEPPALPPRGVARQDLLVLQTDNEDLRRHTQQMEMELGRMTNKMAVVLREKESLLRKVQDLQRQTPPVNHTGSPAPSPVSTPTKSLTPRATPPIMTDRKHPDHEAAPVAKMAELKKLRSCAPDMQGILGSEVALMGVESTSTAEHLVQSVHDQCDMAELMGHSLAQNTMKEFEVELERRQARTDHLKAQNDVLQATVEESKGQAERLSVLMAKMEGNNTALQICSSYSDQCVETQGVLMTLLDTQLGVLLANCRAAGLGGKGGTELDNDQEVAAILQQAHQARRRAESEAHHLLTRLEHSVSLMGRPWEGSSSNSRTTSSSSNGSDTDPECVKIEEGRLRALLEELKVERAAVKATVVELESFYEEPVGPRGRGEAQRLDLENAVLVQELMAVKEEKAEVKAHCYLLEREKTSLELRLRGREVTEGALRIELDHLRGEISQSPHLPSCCHTPHTATPNQPPNPRYIADLASRDPLDLAHDLAVTLERERVHKSRVNQLMSTLEKISRNSEARHKQSAEFVNDLKRANSALITAFDKAKKKYQGRLKKLESQLRGVKEKYDVDTVTLRQRLASLESRGKRPQPTETCL